jgi:hypothetical protein
MRSGAANLSQKMRSFCQKMRNSNFAFWVKIAIDDELGHQNHSLCPRNGHACGVELERESRTAHAFIQSTDH